MKQAPQEKHSARGLRVAVLCARFNPAVTDGLRDGAVAALEEMGASPTKIRVFDIPGAFELPLAARAAAESKRFDAVVALGAVIKGDTDHYDHVAREAARGLAEASFVTGVPVAFGVLTVRKARQAIVRAQPGPENKGAEAARAAVAMVHTLREISGRRSRPRASGGRRRA
jgi:6,7-dimethyl-8-ribityllumazine synthase